MSYTYQITTDDMLIGKRIDDVIYISLESFYSYITSDKATYDDVGINIEMARFFSFINEVDKLIIDLTGDENIISNILVDNFFTSLSVFISILPEFLKVEVKGQNLDVADSYISKRKSEISDIIEFNNKIVKKIRSNSLSKQVETIIYGSCDSRDIFRIYQDTNRVTRFNIVYYATNISIATILATPFLYDKNFVKLESKFLESCVRDDLSKVIVNNIIKSMTPDSIFVIDLMDERFDIIRCSGSEFTKSWNLQKTELFKNLNIDSVLHFDSEEKYENTCKNITKLLNVLSGLISSNRIFFNETLMCTHYFNNDSAFIPFSNECYSIDAFNIFISRVIEYVKVNHSSINFISTPPYLNFGDCTHLWGLHPYHYNKTFYLSRARQIFSSLV
ncbi:DUF6270 domain-containing protein [[Enterobacter] lignolyticus]|uniref:Uncharacterized protein n=1 Tax=Enterobacter lignolyticus (strain SCF1) TaxID=701347 RepID=E3GAR9_ENTLS|nr:DUF6270 domain-containing protein [[Enterobacter] lignolyticus]ADO49980.1 hypothetical protein Entcl_3739 [[Enterobacter] lignolyticus SCF1]